MANYALCARITILDKPHYFAHFTSSRFSMEGWSTKERFQNFNVYCDWICHCRGFIPWL